MRRQILAGIILSLAAATTSAALLGRAPATPGGTDYQAYYDDVLGVTWLADANFAMTSGYDADGRMTWTDSLVWISSLNIGAHLGETHWRLPDVDVDADGIAVWCFDVAEAACRDNEYYYIYEYYGIAGDDFDPFENLGDWFYWANEEFGPSPALARGFNFSSLCGGSCADFKTSSNFAWAVHDGDPLAATVPIPAAVWLLGSALAALGVARRFAR